MSRRGGRRRVWGMQKTILLILAVVVGQSVLAADKKPLIADPIVEKNIRETLRKPTGKKLTKADLEKVTVLYLKNTAFTDTGPKEVAKLQQLTKLGLFNTKAGVAELKKALPKCKITHNAK